MDKKKVIIEALENADVDVYGVLKMTTQVRDILVEFLIEQEAVIRCNHCKHYDEETGICDLHHVHGCAETWFCADGEHK